jgi:hypothetical protein
MVKTKWLTVIGLEVCLFAGPFLIDPAWSKENAPALLAIGALIVVFGITWDHWPEAMQFRRDLLWADMESAGRYHRDILVEFGMLDGVKMFDSMASSALPKQDPVASAYSFIAVEGINEGHLEVWGVPENGSKEERLKSVDVSYPSWRQWREGGALSIQSNGIQYRDLRVKKSTIRSYAEYIRQHDASLRDRRSGA